jgi:hypothetical protein
LPRIELEVLGRTPAYTFSQAAHYLGLPTSTLRSWQDYTSQRRRRVRVQFSTREIAFQAGTGMLAPATTSAMKRCSAAAPAVSL